MVLKSSHVPEVWNIWEISQYVNQAVALDLVGRFVICCKICSIWDLAGFHFLVPELYTNLVLAHDLVETVLIDWNFAQFEILQDFTSWFQNVKDFLVYLLGASWYTQFTASRVSFWCKLHNFVDGHFHNFVDCHFSVLSMGCSWPRAGTLTGCCQPEPAELRSHIVVVGRVNTPWSSTFRYYPLPIESSVGASLHLLPFKSP